MQHMNAMGLHPLVADGISRGIVGPIMCGAIHFDGEPRTDAEEIGNIGPERMLAAELHAPWLPTKPLP